MIFHSPLNYVGGKHRLMEQLKKLFPEDIDCFVDLFCGGLTVSMNTTSNKVMANDSLQPLIEIYQEIQKFNDFESLDKILLGMQKDFSLYKGEEHKNDYHKFRDDYNKEKTPLKLLMLIFCSYNHQIRFNRFNEFNMPNGMIKGTYLDIVREHLQIMFSIIKSKPFQFTAKSFEQFDFSSIDSNDFVYCDPPYLISTAAYNETGRNEMLGWNEEKEKQLYDLLDMLNERHIRFGLSNVISHKGLTNNILEDFSKKYKLFVLDKDYANCSYNLKTKGNKETVEVYVTNCNKDADFRVQDKLF